MNRFDLGSQDWDWVQVQFQSVVVSSFRMGVKIGLITFLHAVHLVAVYQSSNPTEFHLPLSLVSSSSRLSICARGFDDFDFYFGL